MDDISTILMRIHVGLTQHYPNEEFELGFIGESFQFGRGALTVAAQSSARKVVCKTVFDTKGFRKLTEQYKTLVNASLGMNTGQNRVPEPILIDHENNFIIMSFVDGKTLWSHMLAARTAKELQTEYQRAGQWLKRYHNVKTKRHLFDSSAWIKRLSRLSHPHQELDNENEDMGKIYLAATELSLELQSFPSEEIEHVFTHGDFHVENLMASVDGVYGIDMHHRSGISAIPDMTRFMVHARSRLIVEGWKEDVLEDCEIAFIDSYGTVACSPEFIAASQKYIGLMQILRLNKGIKRNARKVMRHELLKRLACGDLTFSIRTNASV